MNGGPSAVDGLITFVLPNFEDSLDVSFKLPSPSQILSNGEVSCWFLAGALTSSITGHLTVRWHVTTSPPQTHCFYAAAYCLLLASMSHHGEHAALCIYIPAVCDCG